ncbi:murein L,D-transpeptidase [Lutibacter sp.]|uniref:L,D-transpeptidase family protein n=1 Tax=Lutibacter sp. TaxID=1925666 RepID=UPI002734216B|nr:L,D-transpeptidase family protein [Lutibacter sp.]MDP3312084.1 L,D-transpeptidase family protein [Lutibacter sp.]
MKFFSFFLVLFLLISCKEKKTEETVPLPKIEITNQGKIIPLDSLVFAKIQDSLISSFYVANNLKTFWLNRPIKTDFINVLKNIEDDGLFQKDFDLKQIQSLEKNLTNLSNHELVEYDFLLTENLKKYVEKISKGTLHPKKLYSNWDLIKHKINTKELLLNFQKKDSFKFAIEQAGPNHLVYRKLKEGLKLINSFPKENYEFIPFTDKIILNDTNNAIAPIKKKLIFWKDLSNVDSITNTYDSETELGVKKFQLRHGLAPDGVIGKGTLTALNHSKERRKKQLISNMERWRWYPRTFENNYLIINIPDYTLHAIKNNDTIRTHKVIVGKFARQTPILSSKLSYIVFNPTWTIPPTILKNDVIPAAKRNVSYLSSKNISVYSQNKLVPLSQWNASKANSYSYVQSPGNQNALGLVKFMFPNRFSVYLHDTNSRGYFDKEIRALSSGCVRVQNPFELTEYLLDDADKWNLTKINEVVSSGKTKNVQMMKNTYVHLLYWTAWSEKGTLQFRDDLYNLDMALYEKLIN